MLWPRCHLHPQSSWHNRHEKNYFSVPMYSDRSSQDKTASKSGGKVKYQQRSHTYTVLIELSKRGTYPIK
ncbi:uncharacterized protein LOC142586047 isoform X7 [Dermacentor variabilis]|uniref:uncharacterized protein LOC142568265 isoform X8 n=1 Tax=Dermacentor variabilis TaxID=34621 RepID=UPI003F5C65FE